MTDTDLHDPVNLALATGKIRPDMIDWARDYHTKDPNGFRSFLSCTVAGTAVRGYEDQEASAAEIGRYAREKGIGFGEAFREIHSTLSQIEREPVYKA